jgi:transcriptional regulator with XRE-family HTH domain
MIDRNASKIVDLSSISGVDRNTLSKVLNGDAQPSAIVMEKLAKALDMSPAQAGEIFFVENLHTA